MLNVNMLSIDFVRSGKEAKLNSKCTQVYFKDGTIALVPAPLYIGLAAFCEAAYNSHRPSSVLHYGDGTFYFDREVTFDIYGSITKFIKPVRDMGYDIDNRVCSDNYSLIGYSFKNKMRPGKQYINDSHSEVRCKPLTTDELNAELIITQIVTRTDFVFNPLREVIAI